MNKIIKKVKIEMGRMRRRFYLREREENGVDIIHCMNIIWCCVELEDVRVMIMCFVCFVVEVYKKRNLKVNTNTNLSKVMVLGREKVSV